MRRTCWLFDLDGVVEADSPGHHTELPDPRRLPPKLLGTSRALLSHSPVIF